MKKVAVLSAVLFLLICTGCSKTETLKCTQEVPGEGMTLTQIMNVNMKDNIVTEVEFGTEITVEEEYSDYIEATVKSLEEEYGLYKDVKGVSFTNKQNGNQLKAIVKVKLNEVSDEDKTKFAWNYGKQAKENLKTDFENQGFTCK